MEKRILLVQDDPVLLELLAHLLRHEGYDCVKALTLEQAMSAVKEADFNLVITESFSSKRVGVIDPEVMRPLFEACGGTPVVLFSTWIIDLRQAEVSGLFDDVIPLPLDVPELVARTRRAMSGTPAKGVNPAPGYDSPA